jgi:hypothetical protein
MTKAVRIQLLIALMCAAMLVYFVLLGRLAVAMISSGRAAAVGLGLAVLIMPVIGLWAMIATLRAGFAHQKLARLIAADGMELDTSARPTRCSPRCAPKSRTIPMTGDAGTGWPAPTTTRGTAGEPGKP